MYEDEVQHLQKNYTPFRNSPTVERLSIGPVAVDEIYGVKLKPAFPREFHVEIWP